MYSPYQYDYEILKKIYGNAMVDDWQIWKKKQQPIKERVYVRPTLTTEQQSFIDSALQGHNVLVDACVGSGKTTSIQALCDAYPAGTRILYMTYSKLLKLDARAKIKKEGVEVTNYHGFAYRILKQNGVTAGISELVQKVIHGNYQMPKYDVMVLDEYQDLEEETAALIRKIKDANPGMQIIAVGDMKQKIQDKTTLDVWAFINKFLGDHDTKNFTKCFRLCKEHADRLAAVWDKQINGVNNNCTIALLHQSEVLEFLSEQNPSDVLCLGQRTGLMSQTLNALEDICPDKYNKKTIFASIKDRDSGGTEPTPSSGIFTTFDGSKGLERKICVIFDWESSYWLARLRKPDCNGDILRNIFLVAASRGKDLIVFVHSGEYMLQDDFITTTMHAGGQDYESFNISEMFDFKFKEDVEDCMVFLNIKRCPVPDVRTIEVTNSDELIDLSPCVGNYQEALFFDYYNIDSEFDHFAKTHQSRVIKYDPDDTVMEKVLQLTAYETNQNRYVTQVDPHFVTEEQKAQIVERMGWYMRRDEDVQADCELPVWYSDAKDPFRIVGRADVIRDDRIIELKFVSELQHTMFLQCACYMLLHHKKYGTLWNVRDNTMWEITIPDRIGFLKQVIKTITKRNVQSFSVENSFLEANGYKVEGLKQDSGKKSAKAENCEKRKSQRKAVKIKKKKKPA